ncbi:uncharacterized protein [Miscanthus floridulus]|jgi:hypothetical protein|uniref:uncharacterized protein n=1 Tax=Miscanthus floridulus TaxID=154761 RepID=UPI003457BE44
MMMEKQIREHQEAGRRQQQQVVVVHSQVRRIKQEEDERATVHETYQHQHASEMRLVLRDLDRQRSRSPLGRVARTAISIGGDS